MKKKEKNIKILKILISIVVIAILIILAIELFPLMRHLSTKQGQLEFKYKIENLGILGFFMLFGLQMAQILLIILPGEPLEVLARYVLWSLGGSFIYNFFCFCYNNNYCFDC
jgi:uncharacterized membrane protein YdjX (TVP38/TMEM64 family)